MVEHPTENGVLQEERQYLDEHISSWLGTCPGKFVLIKGNELSGVYDTQEEALSEGARRFGRSSFLVRRVEPTAPDIHIPALTLGLLSASPTPYRPLFCAETPRTQKVPSIEGLCAKPALPTM